MKLILILISTLLLLSCNTSRQSAETAVPSSEWFPEPEIYEKPKPAAPNFQISNIINLQKSSVQSILGIPSLRRLEKNAEVWLYDNQFCKAHIYFYENDNSDLHAEYIETSQEKSLMDLDGKRADFCISTFLKD